MMAMIKKVGREEPVAEQVEMATGPWARMKGLMFRDSLEGRDGLLIRPCNSIHTFFMRFPIDVVFMCREGKVLKIVRNLPPWRLTNLVWGAWSVLEMSAGALPADVAVGDRLEVACTS